MTSSLWLADGTRRPHTVPKPSLATILSNDVNSNRQGNMSAKVHFTDLTKLATGEASSILLNLKWLWNLKWNDD